MARKIQHLSELTIGFSPDEQEAWGESCKASGVVLDGLAKVLGKKIDKERKAMRLDELLKSTNPEKELMARLAKVEALEEIINLVIDK